MRTDRIRTAVAGTVIALVIAISPAHTAAATPDPTEPPATQPPATEPTDTTPEEEEEEDGEPAPEPSDVSPAVWVGVSVLVVGAVAWAVRQSTKPSTTSTPDNEL